MDQMLIRVGVAAERLGVPRSTLYRVVSRGMMPCVRLGRSVYLRTETLKRWIDEREQAGATAVK
jgi:excisionase family DNA binding protein